MTDKQLMFIEQYLIDCNGAAAARRAGYSEASAKQTAYELMQDSEVLDAISVRLKSQIMTAEEAAKHISDIARTRMNDFLTIREVQGYEQSEQYVSVLLEKTREEIQSVRDFMQAEGLTKKKDQKVFLRRIEGLQKRMLDYQTDLIQYGNDVTRLVSGRPCVMEVAELDLVALAKAQETGRIKSYSVGKDGIKVELYAADGAAGKILEYHGKIVQKHEVSVKQITGMEVL